MRRPRPYPRWSRREFCGAAIAAGTLLPAASGQTAGAPDFLNPPDSAKMVMYYWWFGPAQTEAQVFRELEAMRGAGIGGTFIFPVYPLSASDDETYPFLSEKFLRVLRATCERSKKLSMTVDLLGGGGWPFGGPTITLENSSRTIKKLEKRGELAEGEQLLAEDPRSGAAYISAPTKQRIKSAVIGGEGWVLDHLDAGEVQKYLQDVVAKMVDAVPRGSLRSINFDSLEAFGQTWTRQFPAEFQKRRGYDLIPHLPALWEDQGEDTRHIRCDYWRTITDLFLDHFVRPFHQWAGQRGVALQGKPMGSPVNDLRAFGEIDLAVTEEYDWLEFSGLRWAASGAHIYGQNLVANEGYTWLRQPRYLATLQDIKVGSDVQFLGGMNSIIGHGFSYSPDESGVPGWSYYADVYFHPKNTWWRYFHYVAKYVQRVSFILRQGVPVSDIALFLPEEDEMARSGADQFNRGQKVIVKTRLAKPGDQLPQFGLKTALGNRSPLISTMVTNGYNLDGINNDGLQRARIQNGRLRVGLGDYRIVVLPWIEGMPVESMEKLERFAKAGGKVIAIGNTPNTCYGFREWKEKSPRVREIAARLFQPDGGGRVVKDAEGALLEALQQSHQPDIDFGAGDPDVGFVHRKTPTRDFYFIANTSPEAKRLDALFRVGRRRPEIWDPITGKTAAPDYRLEAKGTRVPIELGGYGSTIIVFGQSAAPAPTTPKAPSASQPSTLAIGGPWSLEAEGASMELKSLGSWTVHDRLRYFSGAATYRTAFDFDAPADGEIWLDLGEVREIAEVEINDRPAGVAWMAPYRLNITGKLVRGRNTLSVSVTNLLINRVLGQPKPDVAALMEKYGKRIAQLGDRPDIKFTQNPEKDLVKEPLPSGLLGPVAVHFSAPSK